MPPPSPRSILGERAVRGRNALPRLNTPLIMRAYPLIKSRFHEEATSPLLLRKINNATSVKTPPFSWLYGGDKEGATNPTS